MKTILSNGAYKRVSDEVADTEVTFGRATFASKQEWKKATRVEVETPTAEVVLENQDKPKFKKGKKNEQNRSK